jgi:hypothetical protein
VFHDGQRDFLQVLIAGRWANHDFEFARLDGEFHVHVVKGQRRGRDVDGDRLRFSGHLADFSKAPHFLHCPRGEADPVTNIHLRGFFRERHARGQIFYT